MVRRGRSARLEAKLSSPGKTRDDEPPEMSSDDSSSGSDSDLDELANTAFRTFKTTLVSTKPSSSSPGQSESDTPFGSSSQSNVLYNSSRNNTRGARQQGCHLTQNDTSKKETGPPEAEDCGFVVDKKPSSQLSKHESDTDSESGGKKDAESSDSDSDTGEHSSLPDDKLKKHDRGISREKATKPRADDKITLPSVKQLRHESYDLASSLDPGMDLTDLYVNVNMHREPVVQNKTLDALLLKSTDQSEVMKKCVLTPGFEKQHSIPKYEESLHRQKKLRQLEKAKTKGGKWFDMKAPEMTDEHKNDLTILQMRQSLDPKQFYKRADLKALPKFYQFGTVVESAADFYTSRIPKKQRKATLVEELLADAQFRQYNKRKYSEIQESMPRRKGAYRHMKRLKKRKK